MNMKRIETLTPSDRRALVHTLNAAALEGESTFSCHSILNSEGEESAKTFRGWLAWLCDIVKGERNSSGYRVLLTKRINHFRIVRPDGVNIYAVGQPLPLLPSDYERNSALAITDIFASHYGSVCVLVEDMYTGETWLYSDIF